MLWSRTDCTLNLHFHMNRCRVHLKISHHFVWSRRFSFLLPSCKIHVFALAVLIFCTFVLILCRLVFEVILIKFILGDIVPTMVVMMTMRIFFLRLVLSLSSLAGRRIFFLLLLAFFLLATTQMSRMPNRIFLRLCWWHWWPRPRSWRPQSMAIGRRPITGPRPLMSPMVPRYRPLVSPMVFRSGSWSLMSLMLPSSGMGPWTGPWSSIILPPLNTVLWTLSASPWVGVGGHWLLVLIAPFPVTVWRPNLWRPASFKCWRSPGNYTAEWSPTPIY